MAKNTFLRLAFLSCRRPAVVLAAPLHSSHLLQASILLSHRNLHQIPSSSSSSSSSSSIPSNQLLSTPSSDATNEFLSRLVFKMRKKIRESYPDIDKNTCDAMLLVISHKLLSKIDRRGDVLLGLTGSVVSLAEDPSVELSPHLWTTAWDLSQTAIEEMRKNRKRELMRRFLHSPDVKEMCHFASEVGIRGDMLRDFRFKWAAQEMKEAESFHELEQTAEEAKWTGDIGPMGYGMVESDTLPERKGMPNYKIYGLNLSDKMWEDVADKFEDSERKISPDEMKPIMGKSKLVTEKILSLSEDNDLAPLLVEWAVVLEPKRVDWFGLLHMIKNHNPSIYLKVSELLLDEKSFEPNIRDYSRLMETHTDAGRTEVAQIILDKMILNGITPDIVTTIIMIHMYCKSGSVERAKQEFENLKKQGFQPDHKVYKSMIEAYLQAGLTKPGEALMLEMEGLDMKPPKEVYIELLRSFSQRGQADEAQRMVNRMQFAGIHQTLESSTLLIEAFAKVGHSDSARNAFDYMVKSGLKPDDRCCAGIISAYVKKNLLDKALDLLLSLEKDGFKPGIATYSVLVDWFGRLLLVDEVEQVLEKIAEKGDLPFNVHVSLCAMYSNAGNKVKALKSLKILLANKQMLNDTEFDRIIEGLVAGGLIQEAKNVDKVMKELGFVSSESNKVAMMAAETLNLQFQKTGKLRFPIGNK